MGELVHEESCSAGQTSHRGRGLNRGMVCLVTAGKQNRGLDSFPLRNALLASLVRRPIAGHQWRGSAPGPKFGHSFLRGVNQIRMMRQPQVVVGGKVNV